jgi:hypothetical protein
VKKRFFPILTIVLLALAMAPTAYGAMGCDGCNGSPSSTACMGWCPPLPLLTTCGEWLANNCVMFGPLPTSAKELFLLALEAQAAQEYSSEALPAEPMF